MFELVNSVECTQCAKGEGGECCGLGRREEFEFESEEG